MHITRSWAVYNEIEEYAADWLENLIAAGLIAPGIVDRRSIVDIRPDDYRGFRQAHFFAGIGVWSYALRRAGVSDDTALWTGSCPCQPFSAAGAGGGVDDERHLWPHWFHLIGAARPPRIYGEQVASKDGLGWLDLVSSDLEGAGYSIWTVDTCSAGSGAPHIRQRLRFCADDLGFAAIPLGHTPMRGEPGGLRERGSTQRGQGSLGGHGSTGGLDDSLGAGLEGFGDGHRTSFGQREGSLRPVATAGGIEWVADDFNEQRPHRQSGIGNVDETGRWFEGSAEASGLYGIGELANTDGWNPGSEREQRGGEQRQQSQDGGIGILADTKRFGRIGWEGSERGCQHVGTDARRIKSDDGPFGIGEIGDGSHRPGPTNGHWGDADWLFCRDGKWRPVEPGTFPLVNGSAFKLGSGSTFEGRSRQGMLKGYGNAIDAEATVDFIEATLEPDVVDLQPLRTDAADLFADLIG